jgi:hypothetical protein
MKKLLIAIILAPTILLSCKKEEPTPTNNTNNETQIPNPITVSNGWEIVGGKSMTDMGNSPSQTFYYLEHVKKHGNIVDLYINSFNAITTNTMSHRLQFDKTNQKEMYYKFINNVFNSQMPNLAFRSISLAPEDYEYIRPDGYFRGFDKIDGFTTGNYNTNVAVYPVNSGDLGTLPFMSNGVIKYLDGNKMIRPVLNTFWYTGVTSSFRIGNDFYITTIDNFENNKARVYKSTATPTYLGNGADILDEYGVDQIVEAEGILFPTPVVYQGIQKSNVFQHGDNYLISILLKMADEDVMTGFEYNPQSNQILPVNYVYPDLNEFDGIMIPMLDRPGNYIRSCYTGNISESRIIYHYDGVQKTKILLPQFNGTTATQYSGEFFYSEGRIYSLIAYQGYVFLMSKEL